MCYFARFVSVIVFSITFTLPSLSARAVEAAVPAVTDPVQILKTTEIGKELFHLNQLVTSEPKKTLKQLAELEQTDAHKMSQYEMGFVLVIRANAHLLLDQHDLVEDQIFTMQQLATEGNHDWLLPYIEYWKGTLLVNQSEFTRAIEHLNQAITLSQQGRNSSLSLQALNSRANANKEQGQYHHAIEDYNRALNFFDDNSVDQKYGTILNNLSTLYIYIREFDKALKLNVKAATVVKASSLKKARQMATLLVNRSYIYGELGQRQSEIMAMEKAKEYAYSTDSVRLQATIMVNLSDIYTTEGDYARAEQNAKDAQTLAKSFNNDHLFMVAQANLGLIKSKQGHGEEGLALLRGAHEYFESKNKEPYVVEALKMLANAYAELGQYEQAFLQHKIFHEKFSKQQFDEREEKLLAIEQKYEADKKEKEIALLTLEKSLRAAADEKRILRRNIFFLLCVIALIFMIRFYRHYISTKRHNRDLLKDNAALQGKTYQDQLTKLFNRRFLEESLSAIAEREKKTPKPCSLVIMDIDKFKRINDTFGHDVGDQVLTEFAQRLTSITRKEDISVRWGGEEFLLIARESNGETGEHLVNRILESVREKPFSTSKGEIVVTTSAGMVHADSLQTLRQQWDKLLPQADKALYSSKNNGRDQAHLALQHSEYDWQYISLCA
ncbi:diguanylate cyclase domain-containing protein [Thalassotalea euphylliae]|uniref:tetratricopeptide repeat-containing diguanylate cyclase n=1 Tax=Thalassotalea euphylliae TaxID=1655234 RepID=UPI00363CE9F1